MSTVRIEGLLPPAEHAELVRFIETETPDAEGVRRWLAGHGHVINIKSAYNVRARLWPGGRTPDARPFLKVDKLLRAEDRDAYEALLRDPGTTVKSAHRWLRERGYDIGSVATRRHRGRFIKDVQIVKHSAELAAAIAQMAGVQGERDSAQAALTRFEQVVMEKLVKVTREKEISPKDLTELSRSITVAVTSREKMERIRREFDREKRRALRAAEDVAKKPGATPRDVAIRMREILGLKTDVK